MRPRQIVVVTGSVHVARHWQEDASSVLLPKRLREPDSGDLGDRIRLVRRLERPVHVVLLPHRLRSLPRIDAGTAEQHRALDIEREASLEYAILDFQVVEEEVEGRCNVSSDPSDLSGSEEYVPRARHAEKSLNRVRIPQVQLVSTSENELCESIPAETAYDRRTHEALMTRDEYARRRLHRLRV